MPEAPETMKRDARANLMGRAQAATALLLSVEMQAANMVSLGLLSERQRALFAQEMRTAARALLEAVKLCDAEVE